MIQVSVTMLGVGNNLSTVMIESRNVISEVGDSEVHLEFPENDGLIASSDSVAPKGVPTLGSSGWGSLYFTRVTAVAQRYVDQAN